MPNDLSRLGHEWRQTAPDQLNAPWDCPECLVSAPLPYDALCPDRVSAALDAALRRGRLEGAAAGIKSGAEWGTSRIYHGPDCPQPAAIVAALESDDAE